MCGLSGAMSSTLSVGEQDIFKDLFNISSLRGVEGSGVIVVQKELNKAFKVERIRSPFVSGVLAYSDELQELLKPSVNTLIGHARWPTKGGTNREALHPHRHKHICGVHNGTLHRVAGELVKDGESDSAKLYKAIAEVGVEEAIKETDGAYALVWIDEQDQTINFLRNGQRTLFFTNIGWQNNISTLYWSSERDMLNLIIGRSFKGTNRWDTYLPIDKHFKYPLKVEHVIKPVDVKEVKPKPKIYPATNFRQSAFRQDRFAYGFGLGDRWDDYDDDIHGACPFEAAPTPASNLRTDPAVARILRATETVSPALKRIEPALKKLQDEIDEAREVAMKRKSKNSNKAYMKLIARRSAMIDEAIKKERENKPLALPPPIFRDEDQTPASSTRGDEPIFTANGDLNDSIEDLFVRGKGNNYAGHCCSWCGSPVHAGEKVYPLDYSDLGGRDKEFVCWDCGTNNDDCRSFIHEATAVVASN